MSCNPSDINQTFIIEPQSLTGGTPTISACTAIYTNEIISCEGDAQILLSTGTTIFNTTLLPLIDSTIDIGITASRFRSINTISGNSSVWTASISVTTPQLELGFDSDSINRIITANNSIIADDILNGDSY